MVLVLWIEMSPLFLGCFGDMSELVISVFV